MHAAPGAAQGRLAVHRSRRNPRRKCELRSHVTSWRPEPSAAQKDSQSPVTEWPGSASLPPLVYLSNEPEVGRVAERRVDLRGLHELLGTDLHVREDCVRNDAAPARLARLQLQRLLVGEHQVRSGLIPRAWISTRPWAWSRFGETLFDFERIEPLRKGSRPYASTGIIEVGIDEHPPTPARRDRPERRAQRLIPTVSNTRPATRPSPRGFASAPSSRQSVAQAHSTDGPIGLRNCRCQCVRPPLVSQLAPGPVPRSAPPFRPRTISAFLGRALMSARARLRRANQPAQAGSRQGPRAPALRAYPHPHHSPATPAGTLGATPSPLPNQLTFGPPTRCLGLRPTPDRVNGATRHSVMTFGHR